MPLDKFMADKGWRIVDVQKIPARKGRYDGYVDLDISKASRAFLKKTCPAGIYLHQKKAIQSAISGENVCMTTGTASGKSLPFYIAAMEKLIKAPKAKVIAVYPLKALAREQEERWVAAFETAGLTAQIGRIDGQTPMGARMEILRNSQVLIMTPDIIHAWLLYCVSDPAVVNLLTGTSLIIVDEAHNYSGVFGSNAAYLFRRLRHIMGLLGASPQFMAASATIASPENHLRNLCGVDFQIIDSRFDTSPKQELTIKLVDIPPTSDLLTSLSECLDFISRKTNHKFITFVDSRKQTEYVASIVSRFQYRHGSEEDSLYDDHLEKLHTLPYRAGYEERDRRIIQERLSQGTLAGIVSTSALELGLDIRYLTLGILVGVPYSATSFYQRIGRIGRHAKGEIIIINGRDMHSAAIFQDPKQLLKMPLSESALYLENARIQYIHALCLARHGGEHDRVCSLSGKKVASGFKSDIPWSQEFLDLCKSERLGEISPEFQAMKAQAGNDPNHVFPLRDVEVQFQVKHKRGAIEESLGSLSYSQLMREAYPGGVYYYTTRPYRVYRVNIRRHVVEVRHEKKYTTKPLLMPTLVFPILSPGNVYISKQYGELAVIESALQIREAIVGYKERRGPKEMSYTYPLDQSGDTYFDLPRFTRNYFTTGVTFTHPAMKEKNVKNDLIAQLLFEAFLMAIPFERREINFASDRHRSQRGPIEENTRFIAIYDQTYGSLRLSSRMLEKRILKQILEKMSLIAAIWQEEGRLDMQSETAEVLKWIMNDLRRSPQRITLDAINEFSKGNNRLLKVIMPGSKGLNISNSNEEYMVDDVFYSPSGKGLVYRGANLEAGNRGNDGVKSLAPFESIIAIPGESKVGFYNLETGELTAA